MGDLLAMIEPLTLARQLLLWTSSVDEDSDLVSQWSFWGYDYAAQRGVGNYYAANDMTLFDVLSSYLRVTGDVPFLNTSYLVGPFANGSFVSTTVVSTALGLARHWRDARYNVSGGLADYGEAKNLLECVPSYIHRVAGVNAANSYMSKIAADIAEQYLGDAALAAELRADADAVAAAVLGLYVAPGEGADGAGGYFDALYPNGTRAEVRHVMDFVYATLFLGVQREPPAADKAYLPAATAAEMRAFVQRELIVPSWMRALSLNDSAAPLSNRSDHGPSGAYIGWIALTVRSFALAGAYEEALAFLEDTLFSATLGPYGQAIEIRPPGPPYKPMAVTLYNEAVSGSMAHAVVQTLFGFSPQLELPGAPPPATPLVDAGTPRGVSGVLRGVSWRGEAWNVVSGPQGLALEKA